MKSKLLHGIIQDLLKMPVEHGKPNGEMHITVTGGAEPDGDELPTDPLADAMGGMESDHDKSLKKNKAIHAKGHKGI